jgi:uncharacterized protein DUF6398
MMKPTRSRSAPRSIQATSDAIVALTDTFCGDHLNDECLELGRGMTAVLCRKRQSPVASGRPWT